MIRTLTIAALVVVTLAGCGGSSGITHEAHNTALEAAQADKDAALADAEAAHTAALEAAAQMAEDDKAEALDDAETTHAVALENAGTAHAVALEAAAQMAEADKADALATAEAERAAALDAAEVAHAAAIEAAETAHAAALADAREEYTRLLRILVARYEARIAAFETGTPGNPPVDVACCVYPLTVVRTGTFRQIEETLYEYEDWGIWAIDDTGKTILRILHGLDREPFQWQSHGLVHFVMQGDENRSNPVAGTAIWRGQAIGRIEIHTPSSLEPSLQRVLHARGVALFIADFDTGTIDARVSGWSNSLAPTIAFENIAMGNGDFHGERIYVNPESPNHQIEESLTGQFYGPDHDAIGARFGQTGAGPLDARIYFYGMTAAVRPEQP